MARDWKNEAAYDYTNDHTPELWAWEFLRRNSEYRKDWKKMLAKFKCDPENHRLPFDDARSKWNLLGGEIIDPDLDLDKVAVQHPLNIFYEAGVLYYENYFSILKVQDLEDSQAVLLFDLSMPIKTQYERVEKELLELQEEFLKGKKIPVRRNKNKQVLWKRYIRILDAYAANIKPKDIAAIIFPNIKNEYPEFSGTKNVHASFTEAQRLVNGKYLKILQESSKLKMR